MSAPGDPSRSPADGPPRHPAGKAAALVIVVGLVVVLMAAASTFGH